MLRKLLKHEFRATARVMGPLFLVMLVLSLAANLSLRFLLDSDFFVLSLLGILLLTAFGIGLAALIIMAIVLMVNRFRTNLMGDEGYVMFTLPASSHQLVWSEIIVSSVWFIATVIVECISGLICAFDLSVFRQFFSSNFFRDLAQVFQYVVQEYGLNVPAIIVEILVLCLLSCAVLCLEFYAALATGHSFANHKMALSVVFFFGFQFALQFVSSILIYTMDRTGMFQWNWNLDGMEAFHLMMGFFIVLELVIGAIYYIVTTVMLKKRLNLQ